MCYMEKDEKGKKIYSMPKVYQVPRYENKEKVIYSTLSPYINNGKMVFNCIDWQKDGTSDHIGIVEKIDRTSGQAVGSIEGNIGNRVSRVTVPMDRVTGYISPVRLTPIQLDKSAAYADMAVPPAALERAEASGFSPQP